jgi:hypothetical protein
MHAARIGWAFVVVALVAACGGSTAQDLGSGDGGAPRDGSAGDASADAPSLDDLEKCEAAGTCILGEAGCCGVGCGTPTLASFTPIHWDAQPTLRARTCSAPQPCPNCATQLEPNFEAFCRSSKCTAIDVRTDAISACTADMDCALRYSTCCEPCGAPDFGLLAMRADALSEYRSQVCLPNAGGCPKCAVTYPPGAHAVCDGATNHCAVRTK